MPYISATLDASSVYDGLKFSSYYQKGNLEMRTNWFDAPDAVFDERNHVSETYVEKLTKPFLKEQVHSNAKLQNHLVRAFELTNYSENVYQTPTELAEPLVSTYPFLELVTDN